ncbi:E6 [Tursiops truncatus papillomavirus 5]|uniref:Protein E6 n=1 Tax=Tursiops truncatus papillomavirus 5 TaxID=1144381 RepID=H6UYN9_PSPV|nr:E6 [Tursiops truncatus papillomavirus 5]
MANPCTLTDLCNEFNIDLYDLLIGCIFCRKHLEDFDKWSFKNRDLFVIWQKQFPFAICNKCVEVRALVDWIRHFDKAGGAQTVEEDTGKALGDLRIRCLGCWKPLTSTELLFHVEDGRPFNKIAGNWRGKCTNCLVLPPRLTAFFINISDGSRRPIPGLTWGFDPPPPQLSSASSSSSWTVTSDSSEEDRQDSNSSISSGRLDGNLSDAESDGQPEVLI